MAYLDHPISSRKNPNQSPVSPPMIDNGSWQRIESRRRRMGRYNCIIYLSAVAIFLILLVNHRNIHQYVDPTARQLSPGRSSAVRSSSAAHHKDQHSHSKSTHNQNHHHHNNHHNNNHHNNNHNHHTKEDTHSLRQEFESWVNHHKRNYGSPQEKEHRWEIWKNNHLSTSQKNALHGPCKHTKKTVFGTNHFKDLTPQEFRRKFLTGYGGPTSDSSPSSQSAQKFLTHQHPDLIPHRHETVQTLYMQHIQNVSPPQSDARSLSISPDYFSSNITSSCAWYQVNCWLQNMIGWSGDAMGSIGKHREPKFNSTNYPTTIDWRQVGAVTDIHTQGSCGACWAITAVETIESAYYISTGHLLDLSSTEVIACDSSCKMCHGGWPQNAYDYVQKHKGITLEKTLKYNGNYLSAITESKFGSSSDLSPSVVTSYLESICPSSTQKTGSSSSSSSSNMRYASLKGYAYATDRCLCYSNGEGCTCTKQNEDMAIRNIASYGPATVCLDASTWQDYTGGIITAQSGCSAKFLDMNHCVQVVGYAFYTTSSNNNNNNKNGGKNQQQQKQQSQGNQHATREGYWIVRNQWGSYWGMNGYAYVAMGSNTCGILNDMTQVFF